jgi:hypothetical protein
MTVEPYTHERPGIGAKLADWTSGLRGMARSAMRETMSWSFYQWTVLALLTATFILVALAYGGIRAELAALKDESPQVEAAPAVGDLEKRIADTEAVLVQAISEMKSGLSSDLGKIGAKLDARPVQQVPKPAAPAPKPAQRPRVQ